MNSRDALMTAFPQADMIASAYLADLTDEEILVRPTEQANHIAWQLGHLIASENSMVNAVCPGCMPPLPDGFAEKHKKDTAASDNPADFLTKARYLELMREQRAATINALNGLSDEDLERPAPESMRQIAPNVAAIFSMQPVHWTMHAGQWAVVRRKLGRPPLF